jgi:uncharacterized protein
LQTPHYQLEKLEFLNHLRTIMLKLLSLAAFLAAAQTLAIASPLDAMPLTRLDADLRCLLGVYTLPTAGRVIITGADGLARGLQYKLENGQFGKLREDASGSFSSETYVINFAPCKVGTMRLTEGNVAKDGVRIRLIEKNTRFTSEGVELHGKLVLPANGRAKSAAVWIEGSNNDPSTDDAIWQYELASRGVAHLCTTKEVLALRLAHPHPISMFVLKIQPLRLLRFVGWRLESNE